MERVPSVARLGLSGPVGLAEIITKYGSDPKSGPAPPGRAPLTGPRGLIILSWCRAGNWPGKGRRELHKENRPEAQWDTRWPTVGPWADARRSTAVPHFAARSLTRRLPRPRGSADPPSHGQCQSVAAVRSAGISTSWTVTLTSTTGMPSM